MTDANNFSMQEFGLILKNEKVVFYKSFALLLIVINMILFGTLAAFSDRLAGLAGVISVIVCIVLMVLVKRSFLDISKAILLISVVIWIIAGYYWVALLVLLLFIFYTISTRLKIVRVNQSGIVYPSFPQKNISWKELYNTILKDGLLTIDLRNNRIIQQLVDESSTAVNEKEFNDFCSQQLKK